MSPKKSKTAKSSLKKTGTMVATAAAGQEFLKRSWGQEGLNRVNALQDAHDKSDSTSSDEASPSSSAAKKTAKGKPKLSKARTMQNTTKEAKALLGQQILGDTRAETKRRAASATAKKTAAKGGRKPALKRLGTMAKTATEGKAYVKRTGKKTTGRKRTGGRTKKSTK